MFPRYLLASVLALAVDYGIYLFLLWVPAGLSPAQAAAPAYLMGALVHYVVSRRFVFPEGWLHGYRLGEFIAFLASGVFGMALTSAVVWLVAAIPESGIHWPKIVAIGVSFAAIYLLRKHLVFGTAPPVVFGEGRSAGQRAAWALAVAILAVAMRLGAMLYWGEPALAQSVDQGEYLALGQNLRQHGVFSYGYPHPLGGRAKLDSPGPFEPTAARAPGYPLLIAALWWQDAPPVLQVRLAQMAMGSIVAVLVYLMALRAFGLPTAAIAGLAMAQAPLTLYLTTLLLAETLFAFLLTVSVWLWTRRQGVLAGVFLGAATLTRAAALPLVGAVLLVGVLLKSDRRLNLTLGLVALAVMTPWMVRNAVTMNAFIPVASVGFGSNLLFGTIDVPYGMGNEFVVWSRDPDVARITAARPTPQEGEREMASVAIARIRAAPLDWLALRLKQYPRYWIGTGNFISLDPVVKYGSVIGGAVFWLLVAAGMFRARSRWRELYPLALFPIVTSAAHFVGSAEERYSLGIVPMATIFAAYAVVAFVLRQKPDAARRPLTPA